MKNLIKQTITIGIPAFNEEVNILYILDSLINQNIDNYIIEKIIVLDDCSSDQTVKLVQEIQIRFPIIKLESDGKRKGKGERLNDLYKLNTSDILFVFDADVILDHSNVILNMLKNFKDNDITFVSALKRPIKPISSMEKLFYVWDNLWFNIVESADKFNDMRFITSSGFAIKKNFAKKIKHTKEITLHGLHIFLLCRKENLKAKVAENAIIFYRLPSNIKEYLSLTTRTGNQADLLMKLYEIKSQDKNKINNVAKIKGILKTFRIYPLYTVLSIAMQIFLNYYPKPVTSQINNEGFWEIIKSSKKVVIN